MEADIEASGGLRGHGLWLYWVVCGSCAGELLFILGVNTAGEVRYNKGRKRTYKGIELCQFVRSQWSIWGR